MATRLVYDEVGPMELIWADLRDLEKVVCWEVVLVVRWADKMEVK